VADSISGALVVWYVLAAASLVLVVYDFATNTPAGRVMKLAWVLVVLYTGPVGLVLYLLTCRQPLPGTHDQFIAAHWKQATGSLLHCVAGDATGIIFSAAIVYHFGLPNGIDLLIEYLSAFVVGLLVFQALFMLAMYGGDYWLAVRKTFFAETVSMNMVMVGMIPTMVILMHRVPGADDPTHGAFWGVMSLATMAGMLTAYPINSWMVGRGLKHGMMSAVPQPKGQGVGHAEMAMPMGADDMGGMAIDVKSDQSGEKVVMSQEMYHKTMREHQAGMFGRKMHDHRSAKLPTGVAATMLVGTFAALGLAVWVTSWFAPIVFVGEAVGG
jgi:Domain of unknown function (DUF4396)